MSNKYFKFLIILIAFKTIFASYDSNTPFVNKYVLVEPNKYVLMWNFTETDIIFKVVVETLGWVGFGLSPNGEMDESDVIVSYMQLNGTVHFTDRHTNDLPMTIIDKYQNWFILFYEQKNGFTTLIFRRKLLICQKSTEEIDIDIIPGTHHIIYSWGTNFANGDITYHGSNNRSSTTLNLLNTINQNVELNMNEIETIEYQVNATLNGGLDTEYFCEMFRLPNKWSTTKQHLVKYETLIRSSQSNLVHHWLLYECSSEFENSYLKYAALPKGGDCFKDPWLNVAQFCNKISLAWAVGSPLEQNFPIDIAYPLGGSSNEFKYFYLQMHYSNPDLSPNVTDNSGVRLYVTKNYRPIEFGVFTTGATSNLAAITIPPNVKSMPFDFYCRKDCTNYLYPNNLNNITLFAILQHSHLTGKEMYTNIVRNGSEIAHFLNDKNYDSDHQFINFLSKPYVLRMDDEIKTTCVYNTETRTKFTIGDIATTDEMCLNFIWYYPRNPKISQCVQYTSDAEWGKFLYYLNSTGQISLTSYSYEDIKASLLSSSGNVGSQGLFQNFFNNTNKTQICLLDNDYKFNEYPPYRVNKLEDVNPCDLITTTTVMTTTTTKSTLPIDLIKNLATKFWNAIISFFKKIF